MNTKEYRGYKLEKITYNTIGIITPDGKRLDLWGHYPKTWKAAKQMVDSFID